MGFKINLADAMTKESTVYFDETDLSSEVIKVEIVAEPGELVYADLKVLIDQLNGVKLERA